MERLETCQPVFVTDSTDPDAVESSQIQRRFALGADGLRIAGLPICPSVVR